MRLHTLQHALSITVIALFILWAPAFAAAVQPLLDLSSPSGGPFPSDRFTIEDPSQNTGLRVSLPKPDCSIRPSDCQDVDVINTLDGFNTQPRLSIPFDGPIDVSSVSSATVFLVGLGDTLGGGTSTVVGINQIVWDPVTNTLFAQADQFLAQHSRWALVVTTDVRDLNGNPIQGGGLATFRRDASFGQTKDAGLKAYRKTLIDVIDALVLRGLAESRIAAMSVFTTRSITAVLEKIRDQIKASTPPPATMLGTFPLSSLRSPLSSAIRFDQQLTTGPTLTQSFVPVQLLGIFPGVGAIAFGKYVAPDYQTPDRFIPPVATRTGVPVQQGTNEIYFNLILPSGQPPASGWPVVIFGHGNGNSKQIRLFFVASKLASHGFAVIGINAVGHGGGAAGTLNIFPTGGGLPTTIPAGGRGIDVNADGIIAQPEGLSANFPASSRKIISTADGTRQTVVDLMQLVRVIQTGGIPNLNGSRMYYSGHSLGAMYGALLLAIEPAIRAGVLHSPGGPGPEVNRFGPPFRGAFALANLASPARVPSLLNVPPFDPTLGPEFGFNENIPFRDQLAMINTIDGATAIQEWLDRAEWVAQQSSAVAYAPHIRLAPLPGVPPKPVIIHFAKGDQQVGNPTTSALLRAGALADRATYFRNDLAFLADNTTPKDPHTTYLFNIGSPGTPLMQTLSRDAQEQLATFLASDGAVTLDPDYGDVYFETPITGSLPEALNFIP